jgi:hypothetical protein
MTPPRALPLGPPWSGKRMRSRYAPVARRGRHRGILALPVRRARFASFASRVELPARPAGPRLPDKNRPVVAAQTGPCVDFGRRPGGR